MQITVIFETDVFLCLQQLITAEGMLFSVCLSMCTWLFTTSLWTYLTNRLWEFHQIYISEAHWEFRSSRVQKSQSLITFLVKAVEMVPFSLSIISSSSGSTSVSIICIVDKWKQFLSF